MSQAVARPFSSHQYADLLALIGRSDPMPGDQPPWMYAVTVRGRKWIRQRPLLDTRFYPMQLGKTLPTLPIWLDVDLGASFTLETSCEETCRILHIA